METQKEPALKAEQLVKELIDMHNLRHTNHFLHKILRIKDIDPEEAKLGLLESLHKISQDVTGDSALRFVESIKNHTSDELKLAGLSIDNITLPDVKIITILNRTANSDNTSSSLPTYSLLYPKTENNIKKAQEIVVKMLKGILAEEKIHAERKQVAGGIPTIA